MDFYRIVPLVLLAGVTLGCANAANYHHAERTSISLEAKPDDPSQPIQGNVGLKTRTILVAPGIEGGFGVDPDLFDSSSSDANLGDSVSVISDFNLERTPGKLGTLDWYGKTHVRGAFLTGEAADVAPAETALTLSGLGHGPLSDASVQRNSALDLVYNLLRTMSSGGDEVATGHVAALDALSKKIPASTSSAATYSYDPASGSLTEATWAAPPGGGFNHVLALEKQLASSLAALRAARAYGIPGLEDEIEVLLNERSLFFQHVGNSRAIDYAVSYVLNFI